VKPKVLFSFKYVEHRRWPAGFVFEGRTFLDADPTPRTNLAIGVERDRNLTGPPRLQRLELLAQDDRELATLEGYEGGVSVSPSMKKVAYYIDKEVLEVRDLTDRTKSHGCASASAHFSGRRRTRILLKRAPEKSPAILAGSKSPRSPGTQRKTKNRRRDRSRVRLHPSRIDVRDFAITPDGPPMPSAAWRGELLHRLPALRH